MKLIDIPGTKSEMLKTDFWIKNILNSDEVIMHESEINEFNGKVNLLVKDMVDLKHYKGNIDKREIAGYIDSYEFSAETRYNDNGKVINEKFYSTLKNNLNLDEIKENHKVKYGMTIKKVDIRSFPTKIGFFDKPESKLDKIQETGYDAFQAVIILHTSKDKKWYFVQVNNYRGWTRAKDIALSESKKVVFDYLDEDNFITICGKSTDIIVKNKSKEVILKVYLGTRVLLFDEKKHKYIVKIPTKDENGNLIFTLGEIEKSDKVVFGHLSYTRANIIKLAFLQLGDDYDWGDKYNGKDCSSFIMTIYKTFGFILPRNCDEQENSAGIKYNFKNEDSLIERKEIFDKVKTGAAIYMPGHTMLYLGKIGEIHYMIHDFGGYGTLVDNDFKKFDVYKVGVTSTELLTAKGTPYINEFTSIIQLEN